MREVSYGSVVAGTDATQFVIPEYIESIKLPLSDVAIEPGGTQTLMVDLGEEYSAIVINDVTYDKDDRIKHTLQFLFGSVLLSERAPVLVTCNEAKRLFTRDIDEFNRAGEVTRYNAGDSEKGGALLGFGATSQVLSHPNAASKEISVVSLRLVDQYLEVVLGNDSSEALTFGEYRHLPVLCGATTRWSAISPVLATAVVDDKIFSYVGPQLLLKDVSGRPTADKEGRWANTTEGSTLQQVHLNNGARYAKFNSLFFDACYDSAADKYYCAFINYYGESCVVDVAEASTVHTPGLFISHTTASAGNFRLANANGGISFDYNRDGITLLAARYGPFGEPALIAFKDKDLTTYGTYPDYDDKLPTVLASAAISDYDDGYSEAGPLYVRAVTASMWYMAFRYYSTEREFAYRASTALLKTSDDGRNWAVLLDHVELTAAREYMVRTSTDGSVVYVLAQYTVAPTDELPRFTRWRYNISIDGGDTWKWNTGSWETLPLEDIDYRFSSATYMSIGTQHDKIYIGYAKYSYPLNDEDPTEYDKKYCIIGTADVAAGADAWEVHASVADRFVSGLAMYSQADIAHTSIIGFNTYGGGYCYLQTFVDGDCSVEWDGWAL